MVPEVSVTEAKRLLDSPNPPRLIDVREQDEWDLCRIPGAELVPLSQWPAIVSERLRDSSEHLILQCHHGGRSGHATEFLQKNGFANVRNLAGGIDAWSEQIDPSIPRY